MTRKPLFSLGLLLLIGIVSMLGTPMKVEGNAPQVVSLRLNAAREPAPSRYHMVRQNCLEGPGIASRGLFNHCTLIYNSESEAPGWSLPTGANAVTLDTSPTAAYYKTGDTIEAQLTFNEPVTVIGSLSFTLQADGCKAKMDYVSGSGTNVLTFRYTVKEGDHTFGGFNTATAHWADSIMNNARIEDSDGNPFEFGTSLEPTSVESQFRSFVAGRPFTHHTEFNTGQTPGLRQLYVFGIIKHLVDTFPATVWIPGLIKNRDTHTDDRRNTVAAVVDHPPFTVDDFSATVEETTTQTAAFDVEFRFFNHLVMEPPAYPGTDAIADEVGTSFTPDDVQISGADITRSDWDVTLTYVGLDCRAANRWRWDTGNVHGPGEVKRSASFLVYKATITPPSGFEGTVDIFLEQGATMDIAGNPSKASNKFTVDVNTPSVQVARPTGETSVVVGDFTVHFNFGGNVVSPFDAEKISITQPDGTALAWDVAVTQPRSPSAAVSAVITPARNFNGDVHITLEGRAVKFEGDYWNLAATEALVVTVDTVPPRLIEAPEIVKPPQEGYTVENEIIVEVRFDEEGVTYDGDNPPYVIIYLGERILANARHATWQKGSERAGSTIVPFAYPIQVGDTATSVSIDASGVLIPQDTRVVDGDGNQVAGQASPAVKPTEPVTQLPTETETDGTVTFPPTTDEASLTLEIPVFAVVPILETPDPKSPASDVPRSPIVFNELGNGSGDADDWLELRNVTGSAVSLKEWELSVVQDGKKEDTSLIVFPDASVPANGLLLITHSDPTNEGNVLAGGDNLATTEIEKKGSTHLYLVNAGLSLPDDGKFLLILRNAKEKLGMNEAFVDVAGGGGSDTDAFVREPTGDYDTHVWPLQVLQAPGGDTEDALGSGKVWQRAKADIVGYHREAWAESAFTGIGYDRKVTQSAATAGTPGYPNGAAKETAATPKGSVTLSEIMFDSGGGTLPQWIELYNNSKTDAINLNRWQLELQNVDSEDLVGRPIVTLTLGEKVIQPNQTLLIVAGPARASSDAYLPADRVYDLLALHEKNLRIKRARDTFLSIEGFYLKLTDRNGNLVDEVGNTDGDRRSDDAPAWALPLSAKEGSRSSLIRRYTEGTSAAEPGKKRSSWVLAAHVKKVASSRDALYWGDADDIGTPGHREGGALPVELSSFSMTRNEIGAVVLTWTTESEVDNAGFNLRRSEKRASGFTLLNPALIAGAGTTGERQTYTFTDTSAKPGIEYYYQIEEVSLGGKPETLVTRLLPGPVSAANRMLTTFGEVKRQK